MDLVKVFALEAVGRQLRSSVVPEPLSVDVPGGGKVTNLEVTLDAIKIDGAVWWDDLAVGITVAKITASEPNGCEISWGGYTASMRLSNYQGTLGALQNDATEGTQKTGTVAVAEEEPSPLPSSSSPRRAASKIGARSSHAASVPTPPSRSATMAGSLTAKTANAAMPPTDSHAFLSLSRCCSLLHLVKSR